MANSSRVEKDRDGKLFIPSNIGGTGTDDHFITSGKLVIIIAVLVVNILIILSLLGNEYMSTGKKIIEYLAVLFISIKAIRVFVINERYYKKMYKEMQENKVTTPALFWNIVNIDDTEDGAQMLYSDMKVGVMVRIERDTITGKPTEFKESHYDALSDFYKELNQSGYNFVQMNIMEQAGNDPRLQRLDELVLRSENSNIADIVEKQVAHIKNIARATLYESDYILVYTYDMEKARYMASEVNDILFKLLDGAFLGFRVMNITEVMKYVQYIWGVRIFDPTEAMLNVFNRSSNATDVRAVHVIKVKHTDGSIDVLKNESERLKRDNSKAPKSAKYSSSDTLKQSSGVNGNSGLKNGGSKDTGKKESSNRHIDFWKKKNKGVGNSKEPLNKESSSEDELQSGIDELKFTLETEEAVYKDDTIDSKGNESDNIEELDDDSSIDL